jgi:hypothetical protein
MYIPGSLESPVRRPAALRADLAGAGLALACAIHCAALPLLTGLLAAGGLGWLASERFGHGVLAVSLALAGASLGRGIRRHRSSVPLTLLGLALPCFALAELVLATPSAVASAASAGGLLVATAHVHNRRLLRDQPSR